MRNVDLLVDLNFGSTGKGLIAGYLGKRIGYDTCVTTNAPNSGHTYVEDNGQKWVMRQLPVGVVLQRTETVLIGPGAVINLETLLDEISTVTAGRKALGRGGLPRIFIHPHASVVTPRALEAERALVKIGSTMKGAGAALVQKIMRDPDASNVAVEELHNTPVAGLVCTHEEYLNVLDSGRRVLFEGSQGYSLGINSGFYPYTTSRECTPAQMLSDALIPWNRVNKVIGVCRTFPIRVANRYNEKGDRIGTSGPCYPDQEELDWKRDLGMEAETTTVTKLPRRIFTFSRVQIAEAIRTCQPAEIALMFCDYAPELAVKLKTEIDAMMANLCTDLDQIAGVRYMGFGPCETDVRMTNDQYTLDLAPSGMRRGL